MLDLLYDLYRAIVEWLWHQRSCDFLIDNAWPCNCRRSRKGS